MVLVVEGGYMLHEGDDIVFSNLWYLEQLTGDTKMSKISCYSKGLPANLQTCTKNI